MRAEVRVGIAMGEVVIADDTLTGAGVVPAQRVEQLSEPGGLCVTGAIDEALPARMPFTRRDLGEQTIKGFEKKVRVYQVALKNGESIPPPERATRATEFWWKGKVAVAVVLFTLAFSSGMPGLGDTIHCGGVNA